MLTIIGDVLKLVNNLSIHRIVPFANLSHINVTLVVKQTYKLLQHTRLY